MKKISQMRQSILLILVLLNFFIFNNVIFSQEVDEEVGQSVMDILSEILPANPDRVMELDEKTGRLIIRDTPSNQKIIRDVIKALDAEPAQIDIETRFVEFKVTDYDEFGINWGNTFIWYDWIPKDTGAREAEWQMRGIDPTTRTIGNLITFGSPSTTTGLDLSIIKLNTVQLDMFLHALQRSDKANLLSSPRVTTLGGQLANIQITTTTPYVSDVDQTVEGGITRWEFTMNEIPIGIKLEVRPTVGEAGIITLELHPEVEVLVDRLTLFAGVVSGDLGWPVVDTRTAQTTVQVKSGETVILGGLIDDDDKIYMKKVPVLGDIPLLGNLFRHKYQTRVKKNLVIFVTPTLVNPAGEAVEVTAY